MSTDLALLGLLEAGDLVRRREVSPVEFVRAVIAQAERWEPCIAALIERNDERALDQARLSEQELARGVYRGPLHGIPITIKDVLDVKGVPTKAGSKVLPDIVANRSAAAVERLEQAGAIVFSKTNTHEFGWGGRTPPTRNPWDVSRIPGGSSGGSAAAVAVGIGFASVGTDGLGSVRIPATFCGVVGLKPTFGRISKRGGIPFAWSLDTLGPIARSVEDVAAVFEAMSGHDPEDPSSLDASPPTRELPPNEAMDVRVGVAEDFYFDLIQPEVESVLRGALRAIEDSGARLEPVRFKNTEAIEDAAKVGFLISAAESSAWHASWIDTKRDLYQPDVLSYLDFGRKIPAIDYLNAQRMRRLASATLLAALEDVEVLVMPGQPHIAPKVDADLVEYSTEKMSLNSANVRCHAAANLAGLPALTIPVGFVDGLPVGLQIVGRSLEEVSVLRVAKRVQDLCKTTAFPPFPPTRS